MGSAAAIYQLDSFFSKSDSHLKESYEGIRSKIQYALEKALSELKNDRHRPMSANQTLAAMLAWDLVYPAIDNPFQVPLIEGTSFYSEYGGFDVGYQLKCLDMCAWGVLWTSNPSKYQGIANRILSALEALLCHHAFSPILGSRGNSHALLGGLSQFAKHKHPQALRVYEFFCSVLEPGQNSNKQEWTTYQTTDDKYYAFFHFNSLVTRAGINEMPKPSLGQKETVKDSDFQKAGFIFFDSDLAKITVATQGQGGMVIQTPSSRYVESALTVRSNPNVMKALTFSAKASIELDSNRNAIQIGLEEKNFKSKNHWVQSLMFGTFVKLVLSIPGLNRLFRNWIYHRSKLDAGTPVGVRRIEWNGNALHIKDSLSQEWLEYLKREVWVCHAYSLVDGHSTRQGLSDSSERWTRNQVEFKVGLVQVTRFFLRNQ
jgi:hypothetical protein